MQSRKETAAWTVCLCVLVFLYGFLAAERDWFPGPQLHRALLQAHSLVSPPAFFVERVHPGEGVTALEPDRAQPGSTLIASFWPESDWLPGLRLIDLQGRTLHHWTIDPREIFEQAGYRGRLGDIRVERPLVEHEIHGSHLFPNGDVLVNVEHLGTVRMDACSSVEWKLEERTHHSIALADDGSFWIPAGGAPDSLPISRSSRASAGEISPDALLGGAYRYPLLRVSADGEVLDEIELQPLLVEEGLGRRLVKAHYTLDELLPGKDLLHLNDIEPLPDSMADSYPAFESGDLLISMRNIDLVLVLDPEARAVRWHREHPWVQQHDPDFMGDGWIGVFDNARDGTTRGSTLGGSRIVAVRPGTDSIRTIYPGPRTSDGFYTPVLGKWQLLANGNLLLTEGIAGRLLEVAPDGTTVWEWIAPSHDDSELPYVTEGTRYPFTRADVSEWPCSPVIESAGESSPGNGA